VKDRVSRIAPAVRLVLMVLSLALAGCAGPALRGEMIAEMERLNTRMHDTLLIADGNAAVGQNVASQLFGLLGMAQEELLITNAYIIPSGPAIDFVRSLTDRGVEVRILTNSLASHDVPAVNSHYKDWRDDLILAGVDLYRQPARSGSQRIMDSIFKIFPKEQF
jgi:phosphatidylserine/phosphatidylglycerophosphate/cardiolipin synthase-like enzyme